MTAVSLLRRLAAALEAAQLAFEVGYGVDERADDSGDVVPGHDHPVRVRIDPAVVADAFNRSGGDRVTPAEVSDWIGHLVGSPSVGGSQRVEAAGSVSDDADPASADLDAIVRSWLGGSLSDAGLAAELARRQRRSTS